MPMKYAVAREEWCEGEECWKADGLESERFATYAAADAHSDRLNVAHQDENGRVCIFYAIELDRWKPVAELSVTFQGM